MKIAFQFLNVQIGSLLSIYNRIKSDVKKLYLHSIKNLIVSKDSIYKSITFLKCPSCRKGKMFVKPGLFRFNKTLKMHENCEVCGQKFEIEPGFWIGALWTSYPIVVLIEIPFILFAVSGHFDIIWTIILSMTGLMILFLPLMLRLGRSIWAHIFIKYRGN